MVQVYLQFSRGRLFCLAAGTWYLWYEKERLYPSQQPAARNACANSITPSESTSHATIFHDVCIFSTAALKSSNVSKHCQDNAYQALAHKAYFIIMPFSSISEQVSKLMWEFLLDSSTLTHSLRSVIWSNLLKYDRTPMLMAADIPLSATVEIKGDLFVRVLSKLAFHVQFWSSLPENMNSS